VPTMEPVASQVKPPDPNAGLGLMSSILGIQQQKQALQTGQYTQQSAQAGAQVDQQKASELQAVGNLVKNASKYKDQNGNFDNQKFANDVATVAPVNGQGIANDATMRAGELYKNQQTLFNLDQSHRSMIGDALGSLAQDPTLDHSKFVDTVANLHEQFKDNPAVNRMLTSMSTAMPNTSGPELAQALRNAAVMAKSPTADLSAPNRTTMQGPGGLQAVEMNPNAVGGAGPKGPPMPQGLSPTEQVPYKAAVTSATSRAGGVAGSDIDRSNAVSSAVKGASAAIPLTTQVDDLAEQIHSGRFLAAVSNAAAAVGMSADTYARQELRKNLGQIKTAAISGAGSDSRAGTIESGFPDETSDPQTIHKAMDYARGSLREDLARGKNLNEYRGKNPDLRGFQQADDTLTSNTHPLMHEFKALTPEQRPGFLRRNFSTADEMQAFKNAQKAADHHGLLDQ
jgi:hypothetical protein